MLTPGITGVSGNFGCFVFRISGDKAWTGGVGRITMDHKKRNASGSSSYERNVHGYMFPHEGRKTGNASLSVHDEGFRDRRADTFRQTYRNNYCKDESRHTQARYRHADVCHIVAHNLGGVNATENVYMGDRRMNQSIGDSDRGVSINCALVGKTRAAEAVSASKKYGSYQGASGAKHHDIGTELLREKGVLCRKDGGIDRRCAAVRGGDLKLNRDGSIRANAAFKIWE